MPTFIHKMKLLYQFVLVQWTEMYDHSKANIREMIKNYVFKILLRCEKVKLWDDLLTSRCPDQQCEMC